MKKTIVTIAPALIVLLLTSSTAGAQALPQFAYNNYDGWIYNNPGLQLNAETIGQAKIRLYVDSHGFVLTLTSPEFPCQGLDSIQAEVRWKSSSPTVALTMALDDADGTPLDSASCLPTTSSSEQKFLFTVPVPTGIATARVRFVSWNAIVSTSGAVRTIDLTGIEAQGSEIVRGDVDGDERVSISDVTVLINVLLLSQQDTVTLGAADVDRDGNISISDVTALINLLLSGE